MSNHIYIVSDVHLGSKFCRAGEFLSFLNNIPDQVELVLNGDTVTHWHRKLSELDMQILDRLREESLKRSVIWIKGNHCDYYDMESPEKIKFQDKYIIDGHIEVRHGHEHDWIRRSLVPLIHLIYYVFRATQRLGAKPAPSSALAKRLTFLYKHYSELYIKNTVNCARRNNYDTVICGHVHHAEQRECNGVLYINTGSWVEDPLSYVEINDGNIELKEVHKKDCNNE